MSEIGLVKKGFNAFQIKLFMAILMVFDHLHYIPGLIPETGVGIIHVITRVVGVWFAFVAVEGFVYTRSRIKYNARLFLWAGIMFAGNCLLNILLGSKDMAIDNNIFLTLALGVLILNIIFSDIKILNTNKKLKLIGFRILRIMVAIGIVISTLIIIPAEGSIVIIPFMLVTYIFRNRPKIRNFVYLGLAILLFFMAYQPYDDFALTVNMLMYNSDFMFAMVIPFIYLYNGERGPQTAFSKYFFYVFYPAHLWLIGIIAFLVAN